MLDDTKRFLSLFVIHSKSVICCAARTSTITTTATDEKRKQKILYLINFNHFLNECVCAFQRRKVH